MDELTPKKHGLLLDLLALEAEVSRVIMLNTEPPVVPENQEVSKSLVAALDDATWNAVVAETEARIGRLNKKAAKRGMGDHFAVHVHRSQDRTILLTEHYLGLLVERKAI